MRTSSKRSGAGAFLVLLFADLLVAQDAPRNGDPPAGDADRVFRSDRPLVVVFVSEPWWHEFNRHFPVRLRPGKEVPIRRGDRWYIMPAGLTGGLSQALEPNPGFKSEDLAGLVEEMREKGVPGLSLVGCSSIRDDDLRLLARVPMLRYLVLGGGTAAPLITAKGLSHLQALTGLETLDLAQLSSFEIERSPLEALLGLAPERVGGEQDGVTDEQLAPLSALGSLREVDLSLCPRITAKALTHMRGLKNLHTLRLQGTKLGDDAIKEIACFESKVRDLSLASTAITDQSLPTLAALAHLTRLDLRGCMNLTDAGLMTLARSRSLRQLVINCPRNRGYRHEYQHITRSGLKALERAMPGCEIVD